MRPALENADGLARRESIPLTLILTSHTFAWQYSTCLLGDCIATRSGEWLNNGPSPPLHSLEQHFRLFGDPPRSGGLGWGPNDLADIPIVVVRAPLPQPTPGPGSSRFDVRLMLDAVSGHPVMPINCVSVARAALFVGGYCRSVPSTVACRMLACARREREEERKGRGGRGGEREN